MIPGKLIYQYMDADYVDSVSATITDSRTMTADMLFEQMFIQLPPFVLKLLKLRDALVKPLGLKTGATFRDRIIERDEEEIIIGSEDKHLSFWVSVYCSTSDCGQQTMAVTTTVKYHNLLGKCYFATIKPFHKLIVGHLFHKATTSLKKMKRLLSINTIGLFTTDNTNMVDFYTEVMGFETNWNGFDLDIELRLGNMRLLLFPRKYFEKMISKHLSYPIGTNGTMELSFDVPTFADVDEEYGRVVGMGATPVMEPTTELWGQRTCYIADPEGNLIEISSFNEK